MGVDAGFFAKNAKQYFWFDRLSNITAYMNLPDGGFDMALLDTYDNLQNKRSARAPEIIAFLEANIKAWMLEPQSQHYHGEWCRMAIKFIQAFPNDEFFVATDHGDGYDLIGDMHGDYSHNLWKGEYSEWRGDQTPAVVRPRFSGLRSWLGSLLRTRT
jgi:hypothetical protein